MRLNLGRIAVVLFLAGELPDAHPIASTPQSGRGTNLTRVVCNGTACGGSGGVSGSPYLYRVKPGTGVSISRLEVGIEDGDPGHYSLVTAPLGWEMSIHDTPAVHDIGPTAHGSSSADAGSCPRVLRFDKSSTGSPQSSPFDLGYSYDSPTAGHHDVNWKTSDGKQTTWGAPVGTKHGAVHSPARRNVILIVLDDIGTDKIRMFDDPSHSNPDTHAFAVTPQLDVLASQGLKFTNFYVNPVCTTSRACFQTGRYSFRHGLGYFPDANVLDLHDCEVTVAELLKGGFPATEPLAPYETGAFGKWHLTRDYRCELPPQYQTCCQYAEYLSFCYPAHPVRNGYDRFYGHLTNTHSHFNGWSKWKHDAGMVPVEIITPADDCQAIACAAENWTANIVRADVTEWIESRTKTFFGYVAFNPPHGRYQAPPFHTEDGRPLVSSGTQLELASHGLDPMEDAGAENDPGYADRQELLVRAMIEAIDSSIGYLLADIGEKADNTMVFVVCDNGSPEGVIKPPHDELRGKGTVYQLGTRVPMIVKGPLIPQAERGGTCSALVEAVDLWRTIGEIAGANEGTALANYDCSNTDIDSQSFLPLILDPDGMGREYAFVQGFSPNVCIDCRAVHERGLTDGEFKYIRRQVEKVVPPDPCEPTTSCPLSTYTEELYNILDDPEESDNLLNGTLTPEQTTALNTLRNLVTSSAYGGD